MVTLDERPSSPSVKFTEFTVPTIGGLIFLASVIITRLVTANFKLSVLMILFSTLAFGAVGFIDDYIKVV
ncbi:MAG: phospho-N-acetylmuramoyl-pentapeptide-transferase, partial [Peptoniphilus harei]|nr:phospho-N-acetylmuramoyl-pentapeptide-transferase [Peptoniphilus harei]